MHGGKSTGPPLGTQNNLKHGIYTAALNEEEGELYDSIALGNVDEELRILRLKLRRALIAWKDYDEGEGADEGLVTVEVQEGGGPTTDAEGKTVAAQFPKRTRKRTDFEAIVDKFTGRIGHLERIRAEIGGGTSDYLAAARKIRDALNEIDETVPAPPASSLDL